ncbi:hypothetical protein TorRG33x02_308740 [Trema orientale]|uniref:Uncharacterized protein n=1 Tax=Trema orientale TaxID=63057 RepID=A0A2P5BU88_TREOI|nr:hypothetical protein TorRG33x02_308740 [Trema orientale]
MLVVSPSTYHATNPTSPFASSSVGAGRLRSNRTVISASGGTCLITIVLASRPPTKWDLLWPPKAWPDLKIRKHIGHSCPLLFFDTGFLSAKSSLIGDFPVPFSMSLSLATGIGLWSVSMLFSPLSQIDSQQPLFLVWLALCPPRAR